MKKITINSNPKYFHTIELLAKAKGITVAEEIDVILTQHFAQPTLIGMPDLVGTEVKDSELQKDGLVKLNGVLYFYQLVGTKLQAHTKYVIADVTDQKVYIVERGEFDARN